MTAEAWADERSFVLPPTVSDIVRRPDRAARAITMLPPTPDTLGALLGVSHTRISDAGLLDLLEASERQLAAIQARQQVLLAEVERRDPDGERFLADEAALALRSAPVTTKLRIGVARQLMGPLAATFALCEAGELSGLHARILAEAVEDLDQAVVAKVQAAVLPRSTLQTPGEVRAAVRGAVARYDTREKQTRHRDALSRRRVELTPLDDGMASVWALLSADGAAALMAAVNAAASVGAGDGRTADQRRADALVQLGHAALCDPTLPTAHGARPSVNITVGLATLLGCSNAPALLDGYGPVRPSWRDGWRPIPRGSGGGWSPTTPGGCSTTPTPCTGRPHRSPATSSNATAGACCPGAGVRHPCATWTTGSPIRPAAPARRTSSRCAGDTTA